MARLTQAQRAEQIRRDQARNTNPALWPNDGCSCNHSRSFHTGGGPGQPCHALGCTCRGVVSPRPAAITRPLAPTPNHRGARAELLAARAAIDALLGQTDGRALSDSRKSSSGAPLNPRPSRLSRSTPRRTPAARWRNSQGQSITVTRASISAKVTFDGYVPAGVDAGELQRRVRAALADAIEFHAPHLYDLDESTDGLVALADGGSGHAVSVSLPSITGLPDCSLTAADVQDAVERTTAWLAQCPRA